MQMHYMQVRRSEILVYKYEGIINIIVVDDGFAHLSCTLLNCRQSSDLICCSAFYAYYRINCHIRCTFSIRCTDL